jgi:hypothetical protein
LISADEIGASHQSKDADANARQCYFAQLHSNSPICLLIDLRRPWII